MVSRIGRKRKTWAAPSDTISSLHHGDVNRCCAFQGISQALCWFGSEAPLERIDLIARTSQLVKRNIAEARTFVLIHKVLARNNIVVALHVIAEGDKR